MVAPQFNEESMAEEYSGKGIFDTKRGSGPMRKPLEKAPSTRSVPEGYVSYASIGGSTFGVMELRYDIQRAVQEAQRTGAAKREDGAYDIMIDGVTFPVMYLDVKRPVPYIKEENQQAFKDMIAARDEQHRAQGRSGHFKATGPVKGSGQGR